MSESVVYKPIGVIRSEHTKPEKTPIQPVYSEGCQGRAEVFPEFAAGLRNLEGFSHIYLVYHLHKAAEPRLVVTPFLQDVDRGVFATRAPCRPNPIGLSIVKLVRREGNIPSSGWRRRAGWYATVGHQALHSAIRPYRRHTQRLAGRSG